MRIIETTKFVQIGYK